MKRDYETLDAIVVVGAMLMVTGMLTGFFLIRDLEESILPILSSLATAILGVPVAYGAFRWGNNIGSKQAAEAAAETSKTATGALAQIAGAGPPPPAAPLAGDAPGEGDVSRSRTSESGGDSVG